MRFLLLIFIQCIAWASHAQLRSFVAYETQNNLVKLKVSDGVYHLKFLSERIVETTFLPQGETTQPASHIIEDKNGLAFSTKNANNEIWLKTALMSVKITKSPFQIGYYRQNELLIAEHKGYSKPDSLHQISLKIAPDEVLYGGGTRVLGMNRRGHKLPLFNKAHYGYETESQQMNFCLPIFLSSKIYMVHFDNPTTGFLDLDSQQKNEINFDFFSGRKTYQVIVGKTWDDLTDSYTAMTGRQPLLPLWALGNFASRFGYHSQAEVMKTVAAFEQANIPVDALILDLYWFGKDIKGTMGNLGWYKDSFPNGKQMINDLKNKGIKTILITEPFILNTSANWQNAVSNDVLVKDENGKPAVWDFYFGTTGLVDVYKKEGKTWFWNIYKNLITEGVAGQWGDLGEPEVLPKNAVSVQGKADEFRNIYGHQWAKMIWEGYNNDFPKQRPFILMRSGYSGSQKYGMLPWTGDVNRSWGGLQGQVALSLQMGLQGLAYLHSDLGGFAGANLDDELYTRWLQYGVFQPIFRPHAQEEVASEPVFRNEKTKKWAKAAIELRYKLLPYNYDLAMQNSMSGKPLMRPLFFEEQTNAKLYHFDKGYFWGSQFLIYPIKEKGQTQMEVYFPKSADWLDFYTGKKYKGGLSQNIALTEAYIPTFVKVGSFIPMTKWVKNTETYNPNDLEIHFFNDDEVKKAVGNFAFDDGISTKTIEEKKYSTVFCNFAQSKKSMKFTFKLVVGSGLNVSNVKNMNLNLHLHHINTLPKSVLVNGKTITVNYDSDKKQLIIPFSQNATDSKIVIKW